MAELGARMRTNRSPAPAQVASFGAQIAIGVDQPLLDLASRDREPTFTDVGMLRLGGRAMLTLRTPLFTSALFFTVFSVLPTGCSAPASDNETGDATTSESAWTQATPLAQKVERALALAVARGASESFLARPASEGGVGLDKNAAKSIHKHSVGADGSLGTADDGELETYSDLDALPDVGDASIQRLRDFAWGAPFLQLSLAEEERARAITAQALFAALQAGTTTLSCRTSSSYSVRSVAWNAVSGCERREDVGTSSASVSYALVENGEPLSFGFTGGDPGEAFGFYEARGLVIRVSVPADSRRYEPVDVPLVVNGSSSGMGTLRTVSAGHPDPLTAEAGRSKQLILGKPLN